MVFFQAFGDRRSEIDHEVDVGKTTAQIGQWIELQVTEPEGVNKYKAWVVTNEVDHVVDLVPEVTLQGKLLDPRVFGAHPP